MDIEKVIREYLPQIVHLSLGTSVGNKPWVCELHFAYDENLNLYFRSKPKRRHSKEIIENPSVAGNIIRQHTLDEYPLGVYFEGTAKQLPAGEEQNKAAECISLRLKADFNEIVQEASDPEGHQFYKITVSNYYVFGKLDERGVKKHELKWNGGAE